MKKRAFTLIELLVVIVIIGILATISIASFKDFKTKANLAKSISFEKNLMTNLFAQSVSKQKPPICVLDFEEGSGTSTNDISGNNLTFSVLDDSRWSTDTPDGSNYSINGIIHNNYSTSEFDQTELTDQLTISGYIKPIDLSQTNGRGYIFYGWAQWGLIVTDDYFPEFYLKYDLSSHRVSSSIPVLRNEWNHIAGIYDGTTIKIYVNGTLAGEKNITYAFPTSNYTLALADTTVYKDVYFIDKLRVFPFAPDSDFE